MTKKILIFKLTILVSLFGILTSCSPIASATRSVESTGDNKQISDTEVATSEPQTTATPNFGLTATLQADTMKQDLQKLAEEELIQSVDGSYFRVQDLTGEWAKLGYYHWWPLDRKPTNFAIRADIKWEIASSGANYSKAGCGFVFHEQGADNLHLSFLSMDGYVRNIRMEKNVFTDLKANYAGKFKYPGDSANIMLIVEKQWITFLVNNIVVVHFKEEHLTNGGLSMAVASGTNKDFGTRCQFQNVELWEFN